MARFSAYVLGALLSLAGGLAVAPASAADLGVYLVDPGICGDQRFLGKITSRFRHQVNNVPNLPNVSIVEFRDVHERRYLPATEDSPIGRRYCGATVILSDGVGRPIWYLIEEGMGFASIGDNVEFCVSGFDRWMVYNGRCRILR